MFGMLRSKHYCPQNFEFNILLRLPCDKIKFFDYAVT